MTIRRTVISRGAVVAAAALAIGCSGSGSGPGGSGLTQGPPGGDDAGGTSSGGASSSSGSPGRASSSGSPGGTSSSGAGSSGGGASSSSSGSSSGAPAATEGGVEDDAGAYPSGPYCQPAGSGGHLDAGCVLPNTTWIGYDDETASVVATSEPYANYSLDDARRSGKRYAMINLAEFDCPGCQNSAMELGSGAASVVQAGGVVIEVLETSGFVTQASMSDLEYWVNNYSLHNTTVKDPDGSGTPTLNFFGRRDQAYIVDLTTMTILQYIDGSIVAQSENSAGLAMAQMHTLLGK